MSKKRISSAVLAILLGGCIMITGCSQEDRTAVLRFPVENRGNTVSDTDVTFSDGDFLTDPAVFQTRLCSLCAAMSASAASGTLSQENFSALSFHHIAKFSYEKDYDGDKVGVVTAFRKFADETLVFVIVRGTKGREWYSNFDVGYEKEHKCFSECADFLMEKTKQYLVNYQIDEEKVRFLITGYSRGGAAANLFSKRLVDAYGEENVSAYTFASPNTTKEENSESYRTIFNLVKSDDVFTSIPFSKWGYRRYGIDIELSEKEAAPDEVREVFRDITGDSFEGFENSADVEDFLHAAYELAPSVDDYYHKRYTVGDETITMYDYMMLAARFLCQDQTEEDMDTMIATADSDFSEISAFFLNGVDMEELIFTGTITKSSVADSHSMLSYMILLDRREEAEEASVSP